MTLERIHKFDVGSALNAQQFKGVSKDDNNKIEIAIGKPKVASSDESAYQSMGLEINPKNDKYPSCVPDDIRTQVDRLLDFDSLVKKAGSVDKNGILTTLSYDDNGDRIITESRNGVVIREIIMFNDNYDEDQDESNEIGVIFEYYDGREYAPRAIYAYKTDSGIIELEIEDPPKTNLDDPWVYTYYTGSRCYQEVFQKGEKISEKDL